MSELKASKNVPEVRVGFPHISNLLFPPDNVPSIASIIGSATPDASSTIKSMLSSWKPCMFSGFVAVLAVANQRFS